jgi:hypothetical protein
MRTRRKVTNKGSETILLVDDEEGVRTPPHGAVLRNKQRCRSPQCSWGGRDGGLHEENAHEYEHVFYADVVLPPRWVLPGSADWPGQTPG